MTRHAIKKICVVFLTGAIMMSCAQGKRETMYTIKKPALSFEWVVPLDWAHEEFAEPLLGFAGVTFVEKRQGPKVRQASLTVTSKKAASFGLSSATLDAVSDDTAKRCLKLPGARVTKRGTVKVALQDARVIEVVYEGLTQILTPGSEMVPMRQKIVVVGHGDAFYVIRYTNDEKKYPAFEKTFEHALKTFRFVNSA